uniref:lactose-binding lectin l-2-like n=1 Tax=Semicossyphus pulcher TaxID=241346 RepID=UPI0037E7B897
MLLLLFLFGLALAAGSPSDEHQLKLQRGGCPKFWFNFNGRCYKYVSTRLSWADAERHCKSQRANLVSIHSLGEQYFIKSLISNFDHTEGRTWIGLSDIYQEGQWMWSDGCPTHFLFWAPKQPNNLRGLEHCVHSNYGNFRRWNDAHCPLALPSVCATRINCA